MSRIDDYTTGRKVYIGRHLDPDVSSDEIRDMFLKYGPVEAVWIARNPPGFAYVTFEEKRDAQKACEALDGTEFHGRRVRVELARGPREHRPNSRALVSPSYRGAMRRDRSRSAERSSPAYGRYGNSPPRSSRGPNPNVIPLGRQTRRRESSPMRGGGGGPPSYKAPYQDRGGRKQGGMDRNAPYSARHDRGRYGSPYYDRQRYDRNYGRSATNRASPSPRRMRDDDYRETRRLPEGSSASSNK